MEEMTYEKWTELIRSGSDEDLLGTLLELDEEDIISYVSYANNEICNGGFFQYYSNAIFDAKKHIEFLHKLEMNVMADLLQQSLNIFPDSIQPVRKEDDLEPIDEIVLQAIGSKDRFHDIESQYYKICFSLDTPFADWIRKNSDYYWQSTTQ